MRTTPDFVSSISLYFGDVFHVCAGPAPAILDWYGHCVRSVILNKLGGYGGMLPQENY